MVPVSFPCVSWTFSILDLCDTVVKTGGVTVIDLLAGLFWDRESNLRGALREQ